MRTLLLSFLLCFVPLCPAFAAEDSAWGTTFTPDALASWLDRPSARYLVVAPGAPSPMLGAAERALTAALRASGKASLVMDAQALGPVSSLDDASIIQRASHLPMDRILVLRLFPDASGELTQATGILYDHLGSSRGAFSATLGTPLVAGPASAAQPKVAEMPAKPAPKPALSPEEQYEQSYIGFDEFVAVSSGTVNVARQFSVPYEGKFKRPLEGKSFYEKVGRQDLVASYDKKMNNKTLLGVAGGAAFLGGMIYAVSILAAPQEDCTLGPNFSACIDRSIEQGGKRIRSGGLAIGASAVGVGLLTAGVFINAHPVSPSEAREIADSYNRNLKAELGLSDESPSKQPPSRSVDLQARLSAEIGAGGGRLLLSGTF